MGRAESDEMSLWEGISHLGEVALYALLRSLCSQDDVVATILLRRPAKSALGLLLSTGLSDDFLLSEELTCCLNGGSESRLIVCRGLYPIAPRE